MPRSGVAQTMRRRIAENNFIQLAYCLRISVDDLPDDGLVESRDLEEFERRALSLLDGVDLATSPERGRLVLECAVETGSRALVEAVLNRGVDVNGADDGGRTALHAAMCDSFSEGVVQLLLDRGAGVNAKDKCGRAAIHFAARFWERGAVVTLLNHSADLSLNTSSGKADDVRNGIDINAQNGNGDTVLHLAAKGNKCDMVGTLLKYNADLRLKNQKGRTPLHIAAAKARLGVVESLLLNTKDVNLANNNMARKNDIINEQDGKCCTALHYAVNRCVKDDSAGGIVKILLKYGAFFDIANGNGITALHSAAWKCNIRILKLMLHESSTTVCLDKGEQIKNDIKINNDINVRDRKGNTALHFAAGSTGCAAWIQKVILLVDHGADLVVENELGKTPLQIILGQNLHPRIDLFYLLLRQEGRTGERRNLLVEKGLETLRNSANLDAFVLPRGNYLRGNALIHIAVLHDDVYMIRRLIKYGANINLKGHLGNKPIDYAVHRGNSEMVELLLGVTKHMVADKLTPDSIVKVEIDVEGGNNHTPLYHAIQMGNCDIVRLLLSHCSNVNYKFSYPLGNNGYAAFHIAVQTGNIEMVKLLLSNGVKVNPKTNDGLTALHVAVSHKRSMVIELLLKECTKTGLNDTDTSHGKLFNSSRKCIDINAQDPSGKTCLHLAAENGSKYIVELLLKYGADLNVKSKNGQTALHAALSESTLDPRLVHGNFHIVQLLLREAARLADDVNSGVDTRPCDYVNLQDIEGFTALHLALYSCEIKRDILEILLRYGADLYNLRDRFGYSCIDVALQTMSKDIVNVLLNEGVDVNYADNKGWTHLMNSANKYNSYLTATALLDAGADVSRKDKKGLTALHHACSGDIIHLLLSRGANINEQSNDGSTPLHYALRKVFQFRPDPIIRFDVITQSVDIFDALFVSSRRLDIKDNVGKTAKDYCSQNIKRLLGPCVHYVLQLYKVADIMQHITNTIAVSSPTQSSDCSKIPIEDYRREIQKIKSTWIDGFCLYGILNYSLGKLRFTKNAKCIQYLHDKAFKSNFKHYDGLILRRFEQAKDMPALLDEVSEMFSNSLSNILDLNIPREISLMILEKTIGPDLMNLRDALQ